MDSTPAARLLQNRSSVGRPGKLPGHADDRHRLSGRPAPAGVRRGGSGLAARAVDGARVGREAPRSTGARTAPGWTARARGSFFSRPAPAAAAASGRRGRRSSPSPTRRPRRSTLGPDRARGCARARCAGGRGARAPRAAQRQGGQRAAVDLAVGGERQRVAAARTPRAPCTRAASLAARRAASASSQRAALARHHVGHQAPAAPAGSSRAPRTTASRTPGCARSAASISPELDAEAAHLHLVVDAAQELEPPVGQPARQVAGAVQPGPRRAPKRIRDEALRGQLRPAQVAARHARAADVQLARHAPGHRLPSRASSTYTWTLASGRPIVTAAPAVQGGAGGVDGGLGGPIAVDEAAAPRSSAPRAARAAPLLPRGAQRPGSRPRAAPPARRGQDEGGDCPLAQEARELRSGEQLLAPGQHQRGAREERGRRSPGPPCRSSPTRTAAPGRRARAGAPGSAPRAG